MLQSQDSDEVHCALESLRYLSRIGHARASFNLAVAYLRGHGVTPDKAIAAFFMLHAARQGYAGAYEPLARMIITGDLLESKGLLPEGRHFVARVWYFRALCDGAARPGTATRIPYSAMYVAMGPVRYH
ncbi:sel1 repeat family protein [Silvimonas amylolytica]|nr:sel1 repeat family protein [Silvimonas amylolytica]